MADSNLQGLTRAYSDDLVTINSLFFLATLPDGTPSNLPAHELRDRTGRPRGALLRAVGDFFVANDDSDVIATIDTVAYDDIGWSDANSLNILRNPDDEWEQVQFFFSVRWNNVAGGNQVRRSAKINYTTVSSNKYGTSWPTRYSTTSLSVVNILRKDYRVNNANECAYFLLTPPIEVESGDQFIQVLEAGGTATPTILETHWGVIPYKLRRQ
jgi:hypothetical protein